ncbi:MAG: hypothetical protein KAR81_07930 [Sulfurimonas sp.]|nr:hypothetical protein [Sulfurimonas sp.]
MKYLMTLTLIIALAVVALFTIKNSDAYLLATLGTIIAGFFYGVFNIAKDEEKKVCYAK